MASEYPFLSPLPTTGGAGDVSFTCRSDPPPGTDWTAGRVVHAEGPRADGAHNFVFVRFGDHDGVRITDGADFYLWSDRIVCHLLAERHRYLVEIALFGMVLALWLELHQVPTLHGSAVVIDDGAVGFLGGKAGGKTSLATACVARGHELVTDDLLAVDERSELFFARPGYPMLRLGPEPGVRFAGPHWRRLAIVHPDFTKRRVPVGPGGLGRFRARPTPLRRLYLLERHDGPETALRLTPLAAPDAIMTLVRQSFLPKEVERYGLQAERLAGFARLAGTVPIARLSYPGGYERLDDVVDAVRDDLRHG